MREDIKLGLKEVNPVRKEVYYTVLVINRTTYDFMLLDIFEFQCDTEFSVEMYFTFWIFIFKY